MAKYHINPETGNANVCHAKKRCRFQREGEPPVKHYATKEEAQAAAEATLSQRHGGQAQRGRKKGGKLTPPLQELPQELTPTPYHPEYERQVLAKVNSTPEEWQAFQQEVEALNLSQEEAPFTSEEEEFMERARKLYGKSTASLVVTTPRPEEGLLPPSTPQEKAAEVARYRELLGKELEAVKALVKRQQQELRGLLDNASPAVRSILWEAFVTKPRSTMDPPMSEQLEALKEKVRATGARLPQGPSSAPGTTAGGRPRITPAKRFTEEELERVNSLSSHLPR